MSTDDSISEDVSSSVALSHDHTSANGGKESEASMVSSEGTVSGLAITEEAAVVNQPSSTPACNISHNIRNLCLGPKDDFSSGRGLPFINPSSLDTLRALVHEIQSSETDPEIWKNCEGRWLHLFQLVEKQYQEQILAQQEQYQCQIQLIQDEIKALVQLQNRQSDAQVNPSGTASLASRPLILPKASVNHHEISEEGLLTAQSSGYGTLSTWEPGTMTGSLEVTSLYKKQDHGSRTIPSRTGSLNDALHKTSSAVPKLTADQQRPNSQPLTSWAQRQKHRQRKHKVAQNRPLQLERREEIRSGGSPKEHTIHIDDPGCTSAYLNPALLKRSDSIASEASGLTYWKLDENELYHPLPDSFENNSFLLMQETGLLSQPLEDEARLSVSLREIYQNKQKGETKGQEWDSLINSDASSPQVFTLDPSPHKRQSERTSGFTSPSRLSSPTSPMSHTSHTAPRPYSEDEASHTATVMLQPTSLSVQQQHTNGRTPAASPSLDDPVVLSLLRQNLREKHARHIADLRAYYESEINTLKEKLNLIDLPLDVEKSNEILMERCEHLERALTEASTRIRELENKNRHLEKQLAEWPERYDAASSTVKALQCRLEETKQSSREKESTINKLRNRLRQLEEAVQDTCKEVDEKEARMKHEHKMLQDLLQEYDLLRKEHEEVKDNLVSTENKLFDANEQISELKRLISKLEAQVKQLEHENMAKSRQALHNHLQTTGVGLFHQPDLLSPSQRRRSVEFSTRSPGVSDLMAQGQTSPPEREQPHEDSMRRDSPLAPVIKALIQMEDTKVTEGRALTKNSYGCSGLDSRRPTVAFVDGMRESALGKAGAVLRAQRSLSPDGHRSSSVPPRAQRAGPPSTPSLICTLIKQVPAPLDATREQRCSSRQHKDQK
ncbi:M-phase phosphoprotein 9 isoform X2 [Trichomycterus rosablanca]|uniref:M-phase phosphoprotein 9 isoform X2 n=1 Tax=Trichomycterus rosablanca TaxID=2290929 RepID=UPI002F34FE51